MLNDDEQFDRWMADFETKRELESQGGSSNSSSGSSAKPGYKAMSKEDYLTQFDGIVE